MLTAYRGDSKDPLGSHCLPRIAWRDFLGNISSAKPEDVFGPESSYVFYALILLLKYKAKNNMRGLIAR